MTKFTTQRVAEAVGYVEHIFIDDGSDTKLAAVLYSTLGDCFSYAHFFSEFRRQAPKYYPTVTAAKEDLFAELDRYVEQGMRTAIRF